MKKIVVGEVIFIILQAIFIVLAITTYPTIIRLGNGSVYNWLGIVQRLEGYVLFALVLLFFSALGFLIYSLVKPRLQKQSKKMLLYSFVITVLWVVCTGLTGALRIVSEPHTESCVREYLGLVNLGCVPD